MTMQETVTFISTADSGQLDTLTRIIKARQASLVTIAVAELNIGDVVALQNLRPKYLDGARATIVERRSEGKFLIRFLPGCDYRATQRFGPQAVVKPNMLRKVEA